MHPSKLKSSQLPHYSRSPPFSKGNVVSPKKLCAPHKETPLLFDINYSSKLQLKNKIKKILNSTMQLCLQKGFIINKIPNNNYSPLNFHSPLLMQRKVKVKMTFLQDHMVIASFVGKKPLPLAFSSYIAHFNHKLGGDKVIFDSVLG